MKDELLLKILWKPQALLGPQFLLNYSVVKALQEKCCHICREYWCVSKWLQFIHITTAEILCHLFTKNSLLTAAAESPAFLYACVMSTTARQTAWHRWSPLATPYCTPPCENRGMSLFKIRPSKESVSSWGAWQAVRQQIQVALSLEDGAWSH